MCYARDSLPFIRYATPGAAHRKSEYKHTSSSRVTMKEVWERVPRRSCPTIPLPPPWVYSQQTRESFLVHCSKFSSESRDPSYKG